MSNSEHTDTPEKVDYDRRCKLLQKELKPLLEKHRIDLQGSLRYTPGGVIPTVAFVDMKKHYEKKKE